MNKASPQYKADKGLTFKTLRYNHPSGHRQLLPWCLTHLGAATLDLDEQDEACSQQ